MKQRGFLRELLQSHALKKPFILLTNIVYIKYLKLLTNVGALQFNNKKNKDITFNKAEKN